MHEDNNGIFLMILQKIFQKLKSADSGRFLAHAYISDAIHYKNGLIF